MELSLIGVTTIWPGGLDRHYFQEQLEFWTHQTVVLFLILGQISSGQENFLTCGSRLHLTFVDAAMCCVELTVDF